jgi:exosortase A-associated hydrolase 2
VIQRSISGHYVESKKGELFVTTWRPLEPPKHVVLFVPPFGDEMNKSRRMIAECGYALAAQSVATVLPDLYGTGDSAGDFHEADWSTWLADLQAVSKWAASEGLLIDSLVAVRLGAELAAEATASEMLPPLQRTVLWNPLFDANKYLTQFLRLRITATAMQGGQKETTADIKQRFQRGEAVQVAGYKLSATLGNELANRSARARLPASWGKVSWLEVQRDETTPLPAGIDSMLRAAPDAAENVAIHAIQGDQYWMATEISANHRVIAKTIGDLI